MDAAGSVEEQALKSKSLSCNCSGGPLVVAVASAYGWRVEMSVKSIGTTVLVTVQPSGALSLPPHEFHAEAVPSSIYTEGEVLKVSEKDSNSSVLVTKLTICSSIWSPNKW